MKIIILIGGIMFGLNGFCQNQLFTLKEVIDLALNNSPKYKLATTQKDISYYKFLEFKSNTKPQISFNGNLPMYNKEYFGVRQPDGTIKFQSIRQNYTNVGFGISQKIPFTGGELSLNTDLTRFDDFNTKFRQYNGTPIYVQLNQPLFGFNELKWNKIIQPLIFEESKRNYAQDIEYIRQECVVLYFDLLDAQSNIELGRANLKNSELNYSIELKRINLGTTTEDNLLQLQLQVLNNKQFLENARYEFEICQLKLKTFLGLSNSEDLIPIIPKQDYNIQIDLNTAIEFAKKNRPEFIAFERKLKEAQRELAIAKATNRQIGLIASFGLNNIGNNFSDIYVDPRNQQRLSIGFNIPIIDWGRKKARFSTATAVEKLTNFNNDLEEAVLIQEITTLAKNFELLKKSIVIASEADSVAERRYKIANNLYQIGKLSITELNIAQGAWNTTRKSYVTALRKFWDTYYFLRRLTLYDFEYGISLYGS